MCRVIKAEGYFAADSNERVLLYLIVKTLPKTFIYKAQSSIFRLNHFFLTSQEPVFLHVCALMRNMYFACLVKTAQAPSTDQGNSGQLKNVSGCRLPSLSTTWTAWSEVQRSSAESWGPLNHINRSSCLLSTPTAFMLAWISSISAFCFQVPLARQDRSTLQALGQKS